MGEGQRERETQNPKQAPGSELSAQSPMQRLNSQTARSWPEPKLDAQLTEPPRRPSLNVINGNDNSSLELNVITFWALYLVLNLSHLISLHPHSDPKK